jgi:ATP-dependent Clp protease ATP-binding subunit ClpC
LKQITLRLDAYDADARRLIAGAQRLADDRGSAAVEPLHLWYELVDSSEQVHAALRRSGVDPVEVLIESERALRRVPKGEGEAFLSAGFLELLSRAEAEASHHGGGPVSARNLLLACAQEPEGRVRRLMRAAGLSGAILREASSDSGATSGKTGGRGSAATGPLEEYGRDLTRMATDGAFDPFVGREDELRRMLQVLARREENNPLLVGESGTGRTALIEALASRIAAGDVPEMLADRRIIAIDSGTLIAGTRLRGELEERMRSLLDAVQDSGGRVILFLPNLATFLETKGGAGDMLANALSRGEVRALGRCTPAELREIEDEATSLSRRFVPIRIEPPPPKEAVEILRGVRPKFEEAHGVQISDEAIEAAVKFARRYVAGRNLPKSAIDLVDEGAARVQLGLGGNEGAEVGPEDIAEVVSLWTGIPAAKMMEEEAHKLLHMEARLRERVVGQDHAVNALSKAVRRGRVGLRDPKRPIGSFLFLGPTGVGKTELAKALAEFLFDDEAALTRLDMSEFMEKHMVARLLGAPPGYVDSEAGGFLTEAVRQRPYSVILFDEIEKAHPDVFNILLQVLEDGRLTDSRGRIAHFRDAVIIMTSNVGSELILEHTGSNDSLRGEIESRLHDYFRPEFLNRVDEVLIFDRLGKDELAAILEIQLRQLSALLALQGIELSVSESAKSRLIDLGYDPVFGARPLKRVIVRELQDPIAEAILRGQFGDGDRIAIDAKGDSFRFSKV